MEEIIIRELFERQIMEERKMRSYLRLTLIPYLSGIVRGRDGNDFGDDPMTMEELEAILICMIRIYGIDYYDSSMVELVKLSPYSI